MTRILAVASAGGHWQQLNKLAGAFDGSKTHFVTTKAGLPEEFGIASASIVRDCNRNEKGAMLVCALQLLAVIVRQRPQVIITTGALPGLIALALGKLVHARTIWVDSVANGEELSMSGAKAHRVADLWMSQWPHVAEATGARYEGSVL